jgi:hypothetical protein
LLPTHAFQSADLNDSPTVSGSCRIGISLRFRPCKNDVSPSPRKKHE